MVTAYRRARQQCAAGDLEGAAALVDELLARSSPSHLSWIRDPEEPISSWGFAEELADKTRRGAPERAVRLLELALASAQHAAAAATSGAEGMMYMGEVRRIDKKLGRARSR